MKTMKLVLEDSRSSESLFLTVNKVLEEREVVELVEPVWSLVGFLARF